MHSKALYDAPWRLFRKEVAKYQGKGLSWLLISCRDGGRGDHDEIRQARERLAALSAALKVKLIDRFWRYLQ